MFLYLWTAQFSCSHPGQLLDWNGHCIELGGRLCLAGGKFAGPLAGGTAGSADARGGPGAQRVGGWAQPAGGPLPQLRDPR